jgi:hypothetical protein
MSCYKQVDSQYKFLTLLQQFYLRIWLSPSWILPSAAKAFPASVTKQIVMSRKMRWQSLFHLPSLQTPSLCKSIVVPYVDTNAKVTNFFPFCTIGISMYQKSILPYFLFPLLSHPNLIPFWSVPDGQTNFNTPCYLSSFFFPLSARGHTRRRNSTGLAKLWVGWPIELVSIVLTLLLTLLFFIGWLSKFISKI